MAKKGSFSKVYDKNGDYVDVEAARFDGTRSFALQGDITASQTWNGDSSSALTLNTSIGAKKVTTDKINDKAVQTGQIDDGAVGLTQIATNAMNGTVQDNDSKLATHAAVKTYVDSQISGQGTYLGKHTVAEINAMVTENLHNGDRVMTSDLGTINLGPGGVGFDVEAGEDLILYKSGSTVQWDSMDGNFKTKQTAVDDPTASGTGLTFIDSASQDENGEMTLSKKTVQDGTTSQKGVVQLEDSHTSTSTTKAATPKNVKEAYDLANTANTGLADKQDKPSSATENNIATFNGSKSTKDSGKAFLPSTSTWDGTSDNKVPTAKAVQAQLDEKLDTDGDGKDVTVTFSEASTRANIGTGEKLSVLFGKIKKWFTDLGTAAFKNVPASGDASSTEVVLGSDTRLSAGASAVQDVTVDGTSVVNASTKVAAVPNASTRAKGAVQLQDNINENETETGKAATPRAVRVAISSEYPKKKFMLNKSVCGLLKVNKPTTPGEQFVLFRVTYSEATASSTCGQYFGAVYLSSNTTSGLVNVKFVGQPSVTYTKCLYQISDTNVKVAFGFQVIDNNRIGCIEVLNSTASFEFIDENGSEYSSTANVVYSAWAETLGTAVGSSSVPAYVSSSGKMVACTDDFEHTTNKVTSFQSTPDNTHYPSEKLVKDGLDAKVDKVANATSGNFAGLDSNGNVTDSGSNASDFATSAQGGKADSAIQGVKVNNTSLTPDANKVVTVPLATTSADGAMSAADKTKLNGIAEGAEANVQADWNETSSSADSFIKNKPFYHTYVSSNTVKKVCTVAKKADAGSVEAIGIDFISRRYGGAIRGRLTYKTGWSIYLEKCGNVSLTNSSVSIYYATDGNDSNKIVIYASIGAYVDFCCAPAINYPKSYVDFTGFGTTATLPEGATEITPVWVANAAASSGTAPVKVDAYGALTAVPMDSTPTASSTNLMTSGDIKTALDGKADKATGLTGATKCKITYNSDGIVTAGADLAASDIPNLDASKITSGTFGTSLIADDAITAAKVKDNETLPVNISGGAKNWSGQISGTANSASTKRYVYIGRKKKSDYGCLIGILTVCSHTDSKDVYVIGSGWSSGNFGNDASVQRISSGRTDAPIKICLYNHEVTEDDTTYSELWCYIPTGSGEADFIFRQLFNYNSRMTLATSIVNRAESAFTGTLTKCANSDSRNIAYSPTNTAKGSTSVPVYVKASGEIEACTDDFARDSEVVTSVQKVTASNVTKLTYTKNGSATDIIAFMTESEARSVWTNAKAAVAAS